MRVARVVVVALALLGVGMTSASAQDYAEPEQHKNPAVTVLRDTIAGGVLGSAVSGVIILYNMGIQGNGDYNWERTLAWGAIIGGGVGLVIGILDASLGSPLSKESLARAPVVVRDGQSLSLDVRRGDQSRTALFPVMGGRF